ncbi:MAG TPA: phosphoenolpyruvate carboxykinase (ATP), partial [Anaerolineales bacterium]|nr:phosphoenolpyruvate carboxykinase (ATP) [Anaerolineales bacterium]
MNNLLNIKTPAEEQAGVLKSDFGLENHGLRNLRRVYWNLPSEALYEEIIFRDEGKITHQGPVVVNTGVHTARAASDKAIVAEQTSQGHVWWGQYNRPFSEEMFASLVARLQGFLQGRDLFVQDCYGGADPQYRLPIRIITEYAWHSQFARNMFVLPTSAEEYRWHVPEFTVICVPSFQAFPSMDGTPSQTFIVINFEQKLCIIGNSAYAGEIKKSIFTVLNYLLPLEGVMPMHCSANMGPEGDVALFFGLSGTGKTTLS